MRKLAALILFACVVAGLVFSRSFHPPSASPSDADALRQLEIGWANASKAVDVNWCRQLLADDWRGVGSTGKTLTKEYVLNRLRARTYRLESTDFGPMYVKMWGNVGVVQGSTTYHWVENGQRSQSKSAWMDVYEKRGDKWVVTLSQISKVQ